MHTFLNIDILSAKYISILLQYPFLSNKSFRITFILNYFIIWSVQQVSHKWDDSNEWPCADRSTNVLIYGTLARNTDLNVYIKWLFMLKQLFSLFTVDTEVLSNIYRYEIMTLIYILVIYYCIQNWIFFINALLYFSGVRITLTEVLKYNWLS